MTVVQPFAAYRYHDRYKVGGKSIVCVACNRANIECYTYYAFSATWSSPIDMYQMRL